MWRGSPGEKGAGSVWELYQGGRKQEKLCIIACILQLKKNKEVPEAIKIGWEFPPLTFMADLAFPLDLG